MIQTSEGNLPQGLDAAIRTGLERGRRTVARRARVRRGAVRSALCLALVLGLFAGGVNASPAFAAAMEELPILGRLVQVFRVNAPSVDGGQTAAGSRAALTMEREGDTEWLTLRYEQSSAGRYHAEFASFPKTVTLTLPGTERVEILSELSRAQDTSQYIKSVYTAEGWVDRAAVVQLELESDADVQLREYQEPGSIVIRLTPAENRLDTIYSLRTLSADSPEALRSMAAPEEGARLLRDNAGRLFVELGQYDTREKAERAAGDRGAAGLIVERRTGNNVPVCYETEEAYQSAVLLDGYNELLQTTVEVEPILAFLEEHLAGASAEVQDTMLRGLTGFLDGNEAGRLTTLQKELDEGVQEELDKQLRVLAGLLDQHPAVTVTWFRPDGKKEGGNYLIATGAVRKIDAYREVMILEGGEQIPFRDLLSLSGECLPDNE